MGKLTTASRWQIVEKIFNDVIDLPPAERHDYVSSACKSDSGLSQEIFGLISEAEKNEHFLSDPVFDLGAGILAAEIDGDITESTFANYELDRLLGRGGSGSVYLAKDLSLGRSVALKILPPSIFDLDERVLRFQQEARAASSFSHPNVAHIYEFGQFGGRYYLSMEYISGRTLREVIQSKSLREVDAIDIALQIAGALNAAHSAGIIHRDIKPENIIICCDGLVKVLDFGLAKPINSDEVSRSHIPTFETKPGLIIGTTAYMSPEQIRGEKLDSKTDIWSLGILLFEMLSGTRPFDGEKSCDIQAKILLGDIPQMPAIEGIPEFSEILTKMISRDFDLRYDNAHLLANDLRFVHNLLLTRECDDSLHLSFGSSSQIQKLNYRKSNFLTRFMKFFQNGSLL